MRRYCAVPLAALLTLGSAGCREGLAPFTPAEREVGGASYGLTFGYGQDADPQWTSSGDSILYHTTEFTTVPQVEGVLLAISVSGGHAVPVFADLQTPGSRPFATPALSPDGERLAYFDMMGVDMPHECVRTGNETCAPQPLLDSAVLRVRSLGEQGSISDDPAVPVRFAGTDPGSRTVTAGPWFQQLFPFQAQHRHEHGMLFRPSWAPDGERITFSDGLAIRIWEVGAESSTVIPGTADGVSAAWSPDGEWIAYSQVARTDSVVQQCSCAVGTKSTWVFRTVYDAGPGTLVLVRPDGSERVELGEGRDPAWSPDGSFLFVRRGYEIYRIARDSGEAVPIDDTIGGRAPAVSPDGRRLAFSRAKPGQLIRDYDIWIVSLDQ
ncbi:MAG TPA: hypothetical protein VHG09_10030 [Longimicrobiales bacterium]|nr:hypothetical protein [Longimicrobiales bacterium]